MQADIDILPDQQNVPALKLTMIKVITASPYSQGADL